MSNNPKRVSKRARTLQMTAEEFEEKNRLLQGAVKNSINILGIDGKLGFPDYILAEFMVRSMWDFGYALNCARKFCSNSVDDPDIGINTGFGSFMDGEG